MFPSSKRFHTKALTLMGLLTAVEILLSRFCSISAWNIKIGFGFVPIAVCALLLGPLQAGMTAALADFLGALLFPIGAYFPGFTLTAFLTGVVFGLLLHRRRSLPRIAAAVAIQQAVLSLLLNTLWISLLYGATLAPLLLTRLAQCAVLAPVQVFMLCLLCKALEHRTWSVST